VGDDRQTRAAHGTIVAYLALFVALGGTGAYAVDKIGSGIKDNAIKTRHIRSGQVKTADLGGSSVNGAKVVNNSLGGADINEASLGLGLLRGETPGPDPQSVRYVAPSGRTTATFTDPNDVAHLTPPGPDHRRRLRRLGYRSAGIRADADALRRRNADLGGVHDGRAGNDLRRRGGRRAPPGSA
jgi:hypothetical protein